MEDKEKRVVAWLTEIIETMQTYTEEDETECEIVQLARDTLDLLNKRKEALNNTIIMDGPVVHRDFVCPRCRLQFSMKFIISGKKDKCDECDHYSDTFGSRLPDGTKANGICGMFGDWVDRDGYCYRFEKRAE